MIVSGKITIPQAAWDIRKPLLLVLLMSLVVTGAYIPLEKRWVSINISILTSLGVALSVFLSFRNNVVYDRYWEGRTLWGGLVNASRTLQRQIVIYVADETERAHLVQNIGCLQMAFVHAFRAHLRDEDTRKEAAAFVPEAHLPASNRNVPAALLHKIGQVIASSAQNGHISDIGLTRLDETVTDMTNILGGCERIKNTPLPPSYTVLAHRVVLAYCFLVPFGLIEELHYFTPVLSLIVAFAFLTLDHISELIEQPFSHDANDLPLAGLSNTIENDVRERIGAELVPKIGTRRWGTAVTTVSDAEATMLHP